VLEADATTDALVAEAIHSPYNLSSSMGVASSATMALRATNSSRLMKLSPSMSASTIMHATSSSDIVWPRLSNSVVSSDCEMLSSSAVRVGDLSSFAGCSVYTCDLVRWLMQNNEGTCILILLMALPPLFLACVTEVVNRSKQPRRHIYGGRKKLCSSASCRHVGPLTYR
jgi:hypothetical protein